MKILLLDDHPLFRKGIAQTLLELSLASRVLEFSCAEEAFSLLDRAFDIDCIFLDLQLPDMNGLDFLLALSHRQNPVPVLVLSGNMEPGSVDDALRLGASAYLAKSSLSGEIAAALEAVKRGDHYISQCLRHALDRYRTGSVADGRSNIRLSRRQQQVLQCLGDGLSNQQIAEMLTISESTVKGHVSTLFTIFNVENRTLCVKEALQQHLLIGKVDGDTT